MCYISLLSGCDCKASWKLWLSPNYFCFDLCWIDFRQNLDSGKLANNCITLYETGDWSFDWWVGQTNDDWLSGFQQRIKESAHCSVWGSASRFGQIRCTNYFCYLLTSGFGQIHEVAKTEMNNLLLLVLSVVEYYVVIWTSTISNSHQGLIGKF